ncbi:MAG TPA: enolase C-terminal domain-like protein [Caldilineaceae bacterium]|nr:enolase C-terminal domain-like protein [Caldilineaceae bacterium]
MNNPRITTVEWARLEGTRPRKAGCNARLGEHGSIVRVPLARLTTEDGTTGWGRSAATPEQMEQILGRRLAELFTPEHGATTLGLPFDLPLWDLAGQRAGVPVYRLVARAGWDAAQPLRAPCYDTSLYIDDLQVADDEEAAALIADEARQGAARGHRSFKIKVGRGARHMGLAAGTRRDILVIKAVRAAVGRAAVIMIDANNGYNLNLAKQVLAETADSSIFWLEEAFHEDNVLYEDLRLWQRAHGLSVLIADGEGYASPRLLDWARAGFVDVIQYDIFSYGFTPWLTLGRELDQAGLRSAPHHYGGFYGNYAVAHLAAAIEKFTFAEWDEASVPGVDTSAYAVQEGHVQVPNAPGFGLTLDEEHFQRALAADGHRASL